MTNGLIICEDEFCGMKQKEQMLILYRNQVKTLEAIKSYKFYYRLTSILGSFLVGGLGALFYLLIEHIRGK